MLRSRFGQNDPSQRGQNVRKGYEAVVRNTWSPAAPETASPKGAAARQPGQSSYARRVTKAASDGSVSPGRPQRERLRARNPEGFQHAHDAHSPHRAFSTDARALHLETPAGKVATRAMQNRPRQALRETSRSEGCRSPRPAPKLPEAPTRRTHRTRPHPHGQASHARTAFAKQYRCASPESGEPPAHEPPQQSDRKTPTQDACANTLLQYEAPVWCGRANPSKKPAQKDREPAKRSGRGSFAVMLVGRFARAGKKGTRFSPPPHREALQWFGRCSGPSFGLSRERA